MPLLVQNACSGELFHLQDYTKWQTPFLTTPFSSLTQTLSCYIIAHMAKQRENPTIECACGCGQTLLKYDSRGRERKFLPSHWSRKQPNMREKLACENCGQILKRPQWHIKKVKHHFCCQACAGAWTEQHGTKRGKNNGHYNTITVPCTGCGSPVSKAESLIKRRNHQVYCPNCIHLTRKGRPGFYVGYPSEFSPTLRTKIRRRDKQTCQICGKHHNETGTLHVHHIDYNKANNDPLNLISLCNVCHGQTNYGHQHWTKKLQALMKTRFSA